jgi:hypothetical protein
MIEVRIEKEGGIHKIVFKDEQIFLRPTFTRQRSK